MLKRMLWVMPLLLVLSTVDVEATNPLRRKRGQSAPAPEFDPKAAGAALALLVGGTLLLSERRRRNNLKSE
jgi:hypothetical protein